MRKSLGIAVAAIGLAALVAPTAALASHKPAVKSPVVGTVCAYTAGKSVTINPVAANCGTATDVALNFAAHGSRLVYEGATSPAPAPAVGDAAAALLRKGAHKSVVVKKFKFSEAAFPFAHAQFPGTFVSSTGDCTSGSLTIAGLGAKRNATQHTLNTDAKTVYKTADQASTCAAVQAGYKAKERVNVTGLELTDASWYASVVNAQ